MSLTFTALSVDEGDAFLLWDGEWNCLFDSGVNNKIVDILNQKSITQIDLAICSHNDNDHAEGFKALLASNIQIKEIWLPSLWASILQFMITHKGSGNVYIDIERIIDSIDLDTMKKGTIDALFNDTTISEDELKEQVDKFLNRFENFKSNYISSKRRNNRKIDFSRIIDIATLAYNNRCKIRWFEPYHCCLCGFKDKGFKALNSLPISQIKMIKSTQQVAQAVYLSAKNKYSLIFEYYKDGHPIVRFSADSDLECQGMNPYTKDIIITAPHHGSKSNDNVYSKINGNIIIWVRTFHSSVTVLSQEFLNRKNRYCIKCPSKIIPKEVSFCYLNDKWKNTGGNQCQC